jgi:hypothetical protein
VIPEEAANRRVGWNGLQVAPTLGERNQVVSVKRNAPILVVFVLVEQCLPHCVGHRYLMTGIGTHLAKQRADGVILACDAVEPSLDRRVCKSDRLAGDRMLPFLRGKRFDLCPQFALSRWSSQQLADHGEAKLRPPLMNS